jgi:5'-methylthioinosine phosphorylase
MRLGIIGGSGAAAFLSGGQTVALPAGPWGETSGPFRRVSIAGHEVLLMSRHGEPGSRAIAPHAVNYRANVWAFRELGVDHLLGINTVGGISARFACGALVLPDQLIDYSWGREHSYCGTATFPLRHVDFTTPFCPRLCDLLLGAARRAGVELKSGGTYGVTQGPRLETAAEIDRMERDGCDLVGMTAMPEAGLARELDLSYAICCVVVNQAAGRTLAGIGIHAEIALNLQAGLSQAERLVKELLVAG